MKRNISYTGIWNEYQVASGTTSYRFWKINSKPNIMIVTTQDDKNNKYIDGIFT